MINPKHENYSSEDFLNDISFLNAIKYNHADDCAYWNRWKETNPTNLQAFQSAETQLRLILSASRIKPTQIFTEILWNDINLTIEKEQRYKSIRIQRIVIYAAAAISIMLVSFCLWFFNSNITISTPYAKKQEVILPDGSRILLNANTTIEYPRALNWKHNRTVKLKGEAYFKVKHGNPFSAYTKNLTVAVLGTEFNIKERRGTTIVALVKGKIEIKGTSSNHLKPTIMKPEELFKYNETTKETLKASTNTEVNIAWMSNKTLAENTTVSGIIKDFEDIYGQRLILEDKSLYNRTIDGVIPMGNKENTLFVIANILNVQIHQQGDTILLKTRNKSK
jgi:transmembrane sensor